MLRIIIADSQQMFRDGIKMTLADYPEFVIVAEPTNKCELLTNIRNPFDVLVLEPAIGGSTGETLIRQVHTSHPNNAILVFTSLKEAQFGPRLIRAGALGFLTKNSSSNELLSAIRRVAAGRPYISPELGEQLALNLKADASSLPHRRLSQREFEVFLLLVGGKSVTSIANLLNLSVKTVSTHKSRIMSRTGFTSISEMVQYAVVHDLVGILAV